MDAQPMIEDAPVISSDCALLRAPGRSPGWWAHPCSRARCGRSGTSPAGSSQYSWVHPRSRTSMAVRVAPVKNLVVGEHSIRRPGALTMRSKVAPSQPLGRDPGATTVPLASWQIRPCRASKPTKSDEVRARGDSPPRGRSSNARPSRRGRRPGAGPRCAVARRLWLSSQPLLGLGPVLFEELLFEPGQLGGHDRARHGVEVIPPRHMPE